MRLLMWLVLVAEGELHLFIMVGDFVHIALLAGAPPRRAAVGVVRAGRNWWASVGAD